MRRRNFPKGYAEMLEKQHSQLVGGLQEIYRRLQKVDLWEGEPLDESSGRPLTHDILAALNLVDPQADGSDAEFIEQPRSSPLLEEPDADDDDADDDQKTPADSTQDLSQLPPHYNFSFLDFYDAPAPAQTKGSTSSSNALSLTNPSPHQLLSEPKLQQPSSIIPTPRRHILPALSPSEPILPDLLWNDPLFTYDTTRIEDPSSRTNSSFDSTNSTDWSLSIPTFLPPTAKLPGSGLAPALYVDNTSTLFQKRAALASHRPSLCHNWLVNGINFDSSDFMGDFHQLSPQGTTPVHFAGGRRSDSLS